MIVCAVILAGGSGIRFHGKKQFVEFHGKPLYMHVYDRVKELIPEERIVVVGVDIPGGETRNLSIKEGVFYIAKKCPDCDKLLLFDAAMPLISNEQIQRLIDTKADSITYVKNPVETVIYKNKEYIDRDSILIVSSPSAFNFKLLYEAAHFVERFEKATEVTRWFNDYYGIKPTFIEGDINLFKVTYPNDLSVLDAIIELMKGMKYE